VDTRSIRTPSTEVPQEKPKTARCAGCGGEYPRKEMVYLHEENHDNLTYFHGERACKPCARRNGVSY
jgi:hypothetical protein